MEEACVQGPQRGEQHQLGASASPPAWVVLWSQVSSSEMPAVDTRVPRGNVCVLIDKYRNIERGIRVFLGEGEDQAILLRGFGRGSKGWEDNEI